MIVHDLRSPLSGATAYLQLLRMGLKKANDSKLRDYVIKTMHSLDILLEMINLLLDVNRLEEGKMPINIQQCDLRKVSNEALEALGALRNKCKISIDSPADLPLVSCDPDLIRRVIGNLLGNAVKFTPQDGMITLSISLHKKYVRVAVADSGPGIPSVYHGKIFEKFGQVEMRKAGKVHSTGLGLTFGKLAVEAHGGSIGVESESGKGSTLWFTLPVDG
jgi:signal transduction histidine kinase